MKVYLLWIANGSYEEKEINLVGVYATREAAEKAKDEVAPGFDDYDARLDEWLNELTHINAEYHEAADILRKANAASHEYEIPYEKLRQHYGKMPKFKYTYKGRSNSADDLDVYIEEEEVLQ